MTATTTQPRFDNLHSEVGDPAKETIVSPRFYTTDFEAIAEMDLSPNEDELRAILEELRADYNRNSLEYDWKLDSDWEKIDTDDRRLFIEFLQSACIAEFSGFLLFKQLGECLKNKSPLLAECFTLLARDEARHAGFLNQALSDFNLSLDLDFLAKNRTYTFFKPKFIFYATYLSERITYWRSITIYRHIEQHPESCFHPIFHLFENWCQDENRHGDFFDALMRSTPKILEGWEAKLWCRFFLLSVFATLYLNHIQRASFHAALGLNAREYCKYVIEKTNETTARVFPVILDLKNPAFYERLEICFKNNEKLTTIVESDRPKFLQFFQKLPLYLSNSWQFLRLYLMKPIEVTAFHGVVR